MKVAAEEVRIKDWIFGQNFDVLASARLPRCGWSVGDRAQLSLTVINFSRFRIQSLKAYLERVSL